MAWLHFVCAKLVIAGVASAVEGLVSHLDVEHATHSSSLLSRVRSGGQSPYLGQHTVKVKPQGFVLALLQLSGMSIMYGDGGLGVRAFPMTMRPHEPGRSRFIAVKTMRQAGSWYHTRARYWYSLTSCLRTRACVFLVCIITDRQFHPPNPRDIYPATGHERLVLSLAVISLRAFLSRPARVSSRQGSSYRHCVICVGQDRLNENDII
ncbi:hypothetical protein F5Y01DRAFT_273713 [Xylaria sp. FL0043]|nr:hypothetical protein F5Y01DRAFT_273713 [Xylaria sp. FL0043]